MAGGNGNRRPEIGGKAVGAVEATGPEEDERVDGRREVVEEELSSDRAVAVGEEVVGGGRAAGD